MNDDTAIPPVPAIPEAATSVSPPPWGLAKRLLFRFAFAYFILYNLPFPLTYVPFVVPYYQKLWQVIVPWVGQAVFGIKITILPNGSGDTTWNYVQVFCFLVIAVAVVLVWTLLDRKRPHYDRLHVWLRVLVRFVLAFAMISYGLAKVFDGQFLLPSPSKLVDTYGESSPMGLLWTFMGSSMPYRAFTGIAEIVGGVLLTMRRTALLGALITIGVMANVVMLNFCYDVPVKLYSTHLLLMAVFLVLPQMSRLAQVFVLNRTAPPAKLERLFSNPTVDLTMAILRSVGVALFMVLGGFQIWMMALTQGYGSGAPKSPLHGVWETQSFTLDGKERPPLLTDAQRWRRLIVNGHDQLVIATMTDRDDYWQFTWDEDAHTLTLTRPQAKDTKAVVLTAVQTAPDRMKLEGDIASHKVGVDLKRVPDKKWLLTSRGFHWINEYPFNR